MVEAEEKGRKKKKLIFKGGGSGQKAADTKYQIDPEDSMASIPDLLIPVL